MWNVETLRVAVCVAGWPVRWPPDVGFMGRHLRGSHIYNCGQTVSFRSSGLTQRWGIKTPHKLFESTSTKRFLWPTFVTRRPISHLRTHIHQLIYNALHDLHSLASLHFWFRLPLWLASNHSSYYYGDPGSEFYLKGSLEGILTLRWLMSYIYGAPILDVSRSHTTTQHSR